MEDRFMKIGQPRRDLVRKIADRCEHAGIEYRMEELLDDYLLVIYMPSGREKRRVHIWTLEDTEKLAKTEFEKCVFVEGYVAICSYKDGFMEAYIRSPLRLLRRESILRLLLNIRSLETPRGEDLVVELKQPTKANSPVVITISEPNDTILILTNRATGEATGLTLKISGLKISRMTEAVTVLEKLANSCFFEIRNNIGFPLMLEPHQEEVSAPRFQPKPKSYPIKFPRYEYETQPLNLYWYAAGAYQMPLLQFLAYYQVLEFYFPKYSQKEIQAAVTNIVKDPTFDPNHHTDIDRLISVVSKGGKGYGDEKAQLRDTIKACIQAGEVRDLMEEDHIKEYFKESYKRLSPKKVSIENKELDLREQLAERLYDIRCGIVHTKADELQRQRILPFTKEESLLRVEVSIVEFLARKAIIADSRKLSL